MYIPLKMNQKKPIKVTEKGHLCVCIYMCMCTYIHIFIYVYKSIEKGVGNEFEEKVKNYF